MTHGSSDPTGRRSRFGGSATAQGVSFKPMFASLALAQRKVVSKYSARDHKQCAQHFRSERRRCAVSFRFASHCRQHCRKASSRCLWVRTAMGPTVRLITCPGRAGCRRLITAPRREPEIFYCLMECARLPLHELKKGRANFGLDGVGTESQLRIATFGQCRPCMSQRILATLPVSTK